MRTLLEIENLEKIVREQTPEGLSTFGNELSIIVCYSSECINNWLMCCLLAGTVVSESRPFGSYSFTLWDERCREGSKRLTLMISSCLLTSGSHYRAKCTKLAKYVNYFGFYLKVVKSAGIGSIFTIAFLYIDSFHRAPC